MWQKLTKSHNTNDTGGMWSWRTGARLHSNFDTARLCFENVITLEHVGPPSLSSRGTMANLCRLAKNPSTSLRSACWQWSRPSPTTLSWSLSWNSSWQPHTAPSSCLEAGRICLPTLLLQFVTCVTCCQASHRFSFLKWIICPIPAVHIVLEYVAFLCPL